jgi:hypothetical protein
MLDGNRVRHEHARVVAVSDAAAGTYAQKLEITEPIGRHRAIRLTSGPPTKGPAYRRDDQLT